MGKLRGRDGTWLTGNTEKVRAPVGDIMGGDDCTQEAATGDDA